MIYKYLEASTGNVTQDTMNKIEEGKIGVQTMSGPYGAFIAVLDDADLQRSIVKETDLYPLFDLARAEWCDWIYLDRDADPIENLPFFDW